MIQGKKHKILYSYVFAMVFHYRRRLFPTGDKGHQFVTRQKKMLHLCCTSHKKKVISPIFCTNLRLEAPLPVYFSCTTFRRCATTSATPLIPKCTTRRWTLRCSNYSVAKRQQFSCALSTATLSLKFENVVPEGWI